MEKTIHLRNRDWLVERLRAEIVGPDPAGEPLSEEIEGKEQFFTWEQLRAPKKQSNGEEIIWQDPPLKRYGAGILYPRMVTEAVELDRTDESIGTERPETDEKERSLLDKLESQLDKNQSKGFKAEDTEELDVNLANSFKPSAIGLSFMLDLSKETDGLTIDLVSVSKINRVEKKEVLPAFYVKKEISVVGSEVDAPPIKRSIWIRSPLVGRDGNFLSVRVTRDELLDARPYLCKQIDAPDRHLELTLIKRSLNQYGTHTRLITVSLVNRVLADKAIDEAALFQAGFRVKCSSNAEAIISYPDLSLSPEHVNPPDSDEMVNKLLYRKYKTFAIGHGCSADWGSVSPLAVSEVWTDVMPTYEIPMISPDLFVETATGRAPFRSSMRKLGGLDSQDDGFSEIGQLIQLYEEWISNLRITVSAGKQDIKTDFYPTASYLLSRCDECLTRIKRGFDLVCGKDSKSQKIRQAFILANKAMLISQLRADTGTRESVSGGTAWVPEFKALDLTSPNEKRGFWRPFQIAFLLMSLDGTVDDDSSDREIVDLIWFPTGGGKNRGIFGINSLYYFS